MKSSLRIVVIIVGLIVLIYSIRGLWLKGIIIEKKARVFDEFLDRSLSDSGLKPEDVFRHFYEERRVGLRKFVHTTKIFYLPRHISSDAFYRSILDSIKKSGIELLEKTNFEIGNWSVSVFILGRHSVSTHLIIGAAIKTPGPGEKKIGRKKDRIAIIIDDIGYNIKDLEYLRGIDSVLTLAVLPKLRYSKEMAAGGHDMGYEILLHLPLEPEEDIESLGPGALFLDMSQKEIEKILDENLETVPHCRGINNHAGSRFTKNPEKMKFLLELIKTRGLFFIDSLVTPQSAGFKIAAELGIPTQSRDVFLDNIKEDEYIAKQLDTLVEISRKKGMAIGICHPSPHTFRVLKEKLPLLKEKVEFVHVSKLLK